MSARARAAGSREDRALVERFLDMMAAERGASANTLAAYRRDILDELLPDLLEPGLLAFPAALLQAYAVALPVIRFRDIHADLLKRIRPVSP